MRASGVAPLHIDTLLHRLGGARKVMLYRRKQTIFSDGNPSDSIFYIIKGTVKLTVTSVQGNEAVLDILDVGSFFGESALCSSRPRRPVHAVAVTEVRLAKIVPDAMLRLIHADPDACDIILSAMIAGYARMVRKHGDNILYSSEERLARALLNIAQVHEDRYARFLPKLTQQELANMIGVTRQRVNVLLKRFRRLGLITPHGSLRVDSSTKFGRGFIA